MPQHVPPRIYRRVPFETAVRLKFDRFHGFVEQYSANLSLGGMFIRSDEPPALGTEVTVEFELDDGFELIRGRGRVAWVRESGEGDEGAGFGLRFLELTPGSRELIFRLVERRVREGDRVFDLEDGAPATAAGRLVHDEEHALLLEERGAAPPWDRPAPRGGEKPAESGGAAGAAAAAGGEIARYGRAAREAAETEAAETAAAQVEARQVAAAQVGAAQVGAAQVEAEQVEAEPIGLGAPPARSPAAVSDADASFAGLVDDDEETVVSGDSAVPESGPADADDGLDGPGAAAGERQAALGAARWAWLEPGAVADAEPSAPAAAIGTAAAGEHLAGRASAERPPRSRRGIRLATAIAAGIAVLVLVGFLLLRGPEAGAPAARAAGGPTAPAAAAVEDGAAAPPGPAGSERPPAEAGASGAVAASPAPDSPQATTAGAPPDPAPAAGPRTIDRIAWQRRDGGVDFEIAGGRPIAPALVDHFSVGGERPRLVVRIAGVERPYSRGDVTVGGPLVERVRTGFHPSSAGAPATLHVVFDLATSGAVAAVDTVGGRVRVRFEDR